jgi:predicted ArsR family transcriptional regulator
VDGRFAEGVERLATLDDPVRRRIFLFVRGERRAVTREDVAAGADVSRKLAAFHLDKLVERGLLTARYGHPPGRGGPGSGRPPKLYELTDADVAVSLPERRYDLVGSILGRALEGSGSRARERALQFAREDGRRAGEARLDRGSRAGRRRRAALDDVLVDLGFEPAGSDDDVVLTNCPFHDVAREAPGVVCAINQAFHEGLLEAIEGTGLRAVLDPAPDRCCVVLRRAH